MHRVELDQQIATAKQFPRNVPMVKQELTALVTMDEETAEECIYALPRGNKTIKGPSARFADALISFWGNARSGAYVVQVDKEDKFVEAVGFFQDVERNVIRQRRVRRPIATAKGYLYNADMINMTGNAACVIAERNAILNGIPKPLWGPAYDKCFALVAGTTQTLGDKIARAKKAFLAMEVPFELVLEKIGRADESKIIPDDVVTLRGMLAALKNGEETSETIFGRGVGTPQHETVTNPLKDKKDPPAEEVRGSSHQIAEADKVIGEGGKVVKDREADDQQQGEQQEPKADLVIEEDGTATFHTEGEPRTVLDRRFTKEDEFFDSHADWKASIKASDLPEPARPKPAKAAATPKAARKAAGEGPAGDGDKPGPAENNAQAAAAPKTEAQKGGGAPYSDGASYLAFMREGFAKAKTKAAINDLWASTRADRRELLGDDELEAIEKDRDAANVRVAGKGAV